MGLKTVAERAVRLAAADLRKAPKQVAPTSVAEAPAVAFRPKGTQVLAERREAQRDALLAAEKKGSLPPPAGYQSGANLVGNDKTRFLRPITSRERTALVNAPEGHTEALHTWLRRLQQTDLPLYRDTLKELNALTPELRTEKLWMVADGLHQTRGSVTPAADLRLAHLVTKSTAATERARRNYFEGKNLAGEALKRFSRPATHPERTFFKVDLALTELMSPWLRRVEQADPDLYAQVLARGLSLPAEQRGPKMLKIFEALEQFKFPGSPAADVEQAHRLLRLFESR